MRDDGKHTFLKERISNNKTLKRKTKKMIKRERRIYILLILLLWMCVNTRCTNTHIQFEINNKWMKVHHSSSLIEKKRIDTQLVFKFELIVEIKTNKYLKG